MDFLDQNHSKLNFSNFFNDNVENALFGYFLVIECSIFKSGQIWPPLSPYIRQYRYKVSRLAVQKGSKRWFFRYSGQNKSCWKLNIEWFWPRTLCMDENWRVWVGASDLNRLDLTPARIGLIWVFSNILNPRRIQDFLSIDWQVPTVPSANMASQKGVALGNYLRRGARGEGARAPGGGPKSFPIT